MARDGGEGLSRKDNNNDYNIVGDAGVGSGSEVGDADDAEAKAEVEGDEEDADWAEARLFA